MAELKVLFIELAGAIYTIKTILNIVDLITISSEHFNKILTNGVIHINTMSVPVVYPVANNQLIGNDKDHYLIVLGSEENNTGIFVDNIIGIGLINWNEDDQEKEKEESPLIN
ncbi:hypothetical protein V6C27_10355 [Peptococcaceae bacterium 1198_IL3148]